MRYTPCRFQNSFTGAKYISVNTSLYVKKKKTFLEAAYQNGNDMLKRIIVICASYILKYSFHVQICLTFTL